MASRELRQRQTFESSNEHVDQVNVGPTIPTVGEEIGREPEQDIILWMIAELCGLRGNELSFTSIFGFMEYTK